jgi:hypothetical protein
MSSAGGHLRESVHKRNQRFERRNKVPELKDYSGPYKPDLKFSDFSKEFLLKLMDVWQWAWKVKDDAWFAAVVKRFGVDATLECATEMWVQVAETVNPKYAEIAKIKLNTVLDSLKCQQLPLDNQIGKEYPTEVKIISPNRVIVTTKQCAALLDFEKSAPELIQPMCYVMCPKITQKYVINPKVKITPVKLPPRESPDEIACRWEYKIEE